MNDNFVILPDTTCDLSADIRKEFSIDYVSAHYTAPDGKERDCLLDWKKEGLEKEIFYKDLRSRPNDYSTAPPSPAEFAAAIGKNYREGKGVLILTISSALSGTYDFAKEGADEFIAGSSRRPRPRSRFASLQRGDGAYGGLRFYSARRRQNA